MEEWAEMVTSQVSERLRYALDLQLVRFTFLRQQLQRPEAVSKVNLLGRLFIWRPRVHIGLVILKSNFFGFTVS